MKIVKSPVSPFSSPLVQASQTVVGQVYVGPTSREVLVRISAGKHYIEAHNGSEDSLPFVVLSNGTLRMVGPTAKLSKADASLTASAADAGSVKEYVG